MEKSMFEQDLEAMIAASIVEGRSPQEINDILENSKIVHDNGDEAPETQADEEGGAEF